ncbi:MAG: filamentous hemagglutinin N-terminal domain-containing protein [Selenomonas sp.]|uniref:two-partner secretion domain-containing protein n=1 Tax=Selenomonas sp. TaxID=2053611 RepID=UPI0025DFD862|nr:filamentous hemagglutinin N-terminal domain-containing protein [Selenomonas sp.]MCR5757444.1 filamentous hemagglutinin N-terminal domain-containing protein [Selenomonas sp.]
MRQLRRSASFMAAGVMMVGSAPQTLAMPQGGQVVAGAAEIAQKNAEMAIRQMSQNAVINWQSFNIGANERVNILQPNSQAAILNRVMDGHATQILGALQANGRVFVVNPAGILFAPGAQVNASSIIASTLDISNADFMAGRYAFVSQKDSGKVINNGELIAQNQGLVALLGKEAENDGVIVAQKGTAALAAGSAISLDFNGDGKVSVIPSQEAVDHVVTNRGLVEADGGLVFMSAAAGDELTNSVLNQEGMIKAQSFDGKTGRVQLTADDVKVKAGSTIDVRGTDGGKVEIGGGWQGSGDLAHAKQVQIEAGANIKADAQAENGHGGQVAVWSDGKTSFQGTISARGKGTGAGGRVETSGHVLDVTGEVSAASDQQQGEWLLDPYNVTITEGGDDASEKINADYTAGKPNSQIANTVINAALKDNTKVRISTGSAGTDDGDIVVDGAIKSSGTNATLSLEAARDIIINKDIKGDQLNLDFQSNSGNKGKFMGGKISQAASSTITTNGGSVYFHGGNKDDMARATVKGESGIQLAGKIATAGGDITLHGATNDENSDGVQITGTVDAGIGKLSLLAHNEAGGNGLAYDGELIARDMQLTMDAVKGSGKIQSVADDGQKGVLSIQTETRNGTISLGSGEGLQVSGKLLDGGFAKTKIGAEDNAGLVQVGSDIETTGDFVIHGGSLALNAGLKTDQGITLRTAGKVQATDAGKITAEVLDVETKGDVKLNTDVAVIKGQANSLSIKNTSSRQNGGLTLGDAEGQLTAVKDIQIQSDGILTSAAGAVHSTAGDIELKADSFSLADDSVRGKGVLTIDTLTVGKSFGLGDAKGDVELSGIGFAAAGFSGIHFGSKDTGAVNIGTLTVNDNVSFTSGSSITVKGKVSSGDKAMAFTAAGKDGFAMEAGSELDAGTADIAVKADKLSLEGIFSKQNTGTLSFARSNTESYTIGGNDASAYITAESLGKIGDTFKNVIIGSESGGAVSLGDMAETPAYLTVKSGQTATITGNVTAKSLVLAAEKGIAEDGGSIQADALLLQGGKADLTGERNEIKTLAANISGALTVNNETDMTIGSVENRNGDQTATAEGITTKAGAVKITMAADKGLTMGTIDTGAADISISADAIAKGKATGKVTTSGKVQVYTTTADKTIAIDTKEHEGALNIDSDAFAQTGAFGNSYGELIIGRRTDEQDGVSQTGKVIIKHTNFSSKTTVRTENQVEFADSNIVGGDLTVHATGLQLDKDSTTDIANHNLNLNLTDSLDLGEGIINGSGKLNITTPEGKNIYLGGAGFSLPDGEEQGYKIGYGTVNSNLTGFSDFGITTKENVYLYQGGIDKSVKISGAKGVHVMEDVTLGSTEPAAATELTLGSSDGAIELAAGKTLTINGANTTVNAMAKEIKLGDGAKLAVQAGPVESSAAGKGSVTLTADALTIGTDALIDGGSGSFAMKTDNLTVDRGDATTNVQGKGELTLSTKNAGTNMLVEQDLTAAENGLHITAADINGGIFGDGFTELMLGNETGTGTLSIDRVGFTNSLTLQNGAGGAIVFKGANSVAAGKAVTLKAGRIANEIGGSFEAQSGAAGASQLNIYTNDLGQLKGTDGKTILGTGTLGLSTYDGSTTISITKDKQAGGLNLYDALLDGTGAFANSFSSFAIGNEDQQAITIAGGTLQKPTVLTTSTAGTISGSGLQADNVAFVGGAVELEGNNAIGKVAARAKSIAIEEAAGKKLSVGNVGGLEGITATTGDIHLKTDQLDLVDEAKLAGKGDLTMEQKTEGVALNIGDTAINKHGQGALNLQSAWFGGYDKNPAIADGFRHIYLGSGYGDANIDSSTDLHFLDPTTVRSGFEQAVSKSKTTTISGQTHIHLAGTDGIEFMAGTFKMNGASTIETESGNITLTADTVDLTSNNAEGTIKTAGKPGAKGGQLNIRTLDENRGIKVGSFDGQLGLEALYLEALYLDSSYFDADSKTRVFAKGFDAINIGRGAGKGSYEQAGTINFEDTINVIQGYRNAQAAVKISGKMSFGEKDYNIHSQNVVLSGVDIETTTGNVNISTNSLTNDTSQGSNSIKTTQGGKLTLDTFDPEREIHIGKTGTEGLDIDKAWFDTDTTKETAIFHGFNEINFGGEDHTGKITVNDFTAPKSNGTTTSVVNIQTKGDVDQSSTGGGLSADKVTIASGGDINLSNPENHIKEIGDVTGKTVAINNTPANGKTVTENTTTITGHIQGETVTFQTDGNLKIDSTGSIESTVGGVMLDASKGHFINENTKPGKEVIKTPESQRWIIHTDSPEGDNPGTLVPNGIRYDTQDDSEIKNPKQKDYGWDGNVLAYTKPLVVNVTSERTYGDGNANFITSDAFKVELADKDHKGTERERSQYKQLLDALRNEPDKSYRWDEKLTKTTDVNTTGGPAEGAVYGSVPQGTATETDRLVEYTGDNNLNATIHIDFKIVPRHLTIQAIDDSRIYGENNPNFQYKISEGTLAAGDSLNTKYSSTANSRSNVGTYAIDITDVNVIGNAKKGDYVIDKQAGKLDIKPRDVLITAGSASRTYGEENPVVEAYTVERGTTGSGRGLLDDDQITHVTMYYDENMKPTTDAGVYKDAIHVSDGWTFVGTDPKNYNFSYAPGTLTIYAEEAQKSITEQESQQNAPEPTVPEKPQPTDESDTQVTEPESQPTTPEPTVPEKPQPTDESDTQVTEPESQPTTPEPEVPEQPQPTDEPDTQVTEPESQPTTPEPEVPEQPQPTENIAIELVTNTTIKTSIDAGTQSNLPHTIGSDTPQTVSSVLSSTAPVSGGQAGFVSEVGTMDPNIEAPVNIAGSLLQPNSIVVTGGDNEPSTQSFEVAADGSFGLVLGENTSSTQENHVGEHKGEDGRSETQGAIPVLHTDGESKTLDGIYTINYNPEKLAIMPASQKVTIPEPSEIRKDSIKDYNFMYQSREGNYEVTYGNGIVAIYPEDKDSLNVLMHGSKNAVRAVLSTGILSAIQDIGAMPNQIRAVYIFTKLQ